MELLNHGRKTTVGLSPDYAALNVLGFTCYAVYTFGLAYSRPIKDEYASRHCAEASLSGGTACGAKVTKTEGRRAFRGARTGYVRPLVGAAALVRRYGKEGGELGPLHFLPKCFCQKLVPFE